MRWTMIALLVLIAEVTKIPQATRVPTPAPTPIVVSECGPCCGQ
jgi:hypothetical protein